MLSVWIGIACALGGIGIGLAWAVVLRRSRATLSDTLRALSADALQRNNEAFLQLATSTLERYQAGARAELAERERAVEALVQPLRASLQRVDGVLGEMEKSRIASHAALSEQLRGLVETQIPMLRGETAALVQALRQPAVRGRWGEMQLHRVVEMAGMLEHCDFLEQPTRIAEERALRPDMIVRLPGGKQLVIDAKAPLSAYLEASEATDETTRASRLAAHAQQVREHMVALGRKGYWEQFHPSPEFVVMFLPGEMFFSAALQQDPSLIEFGVNEKVIVATPTTLIALLRAVAYGWRQEALAANAQQVAELGRELYTRIGVLARHWGELGERLGKAVEAYNRSVVTLESRVLVSARRFRDLQAAAPDSQIDVQSQVPLTPRELQAEELVQSDPQRLC